MPARDREGAAVKSRQLRAGIYRTAGRARHDSSLQALREHARAGGDELAGESFDDGQSGARLDRPDLDALRGATETGLFGPAWCLAPDRLARAHAYRVRRPDELARFGLTVRFTDASRPWPPVVRVR